MGIEFAEKMLDSMVDESGHCGERGLSAKQFAILSPYLGEGEWEYAGGWSGDYSYRHFYSTDYTGNIGKYRVVLNEFDHFNARYTVVSIDLRPKEEYEEELRIKRALRFEGGAWVGEPKSRMDMELELLRIGGYERLAYGRRGTEWVSIYTFADSDGNCIVWKTGSSLELWDEDADKYVEAEVGDKVVMKATVKEHGEWKGVKQTVITRPSIKAIEKRVA